MILNNTEMYIYTVYTYHNYTIINTILVYSNFFSAYHSYLPLKQWILKLYEKRITEYFSLPYDFTSWPKNRFTGLVRPHSGIVAFHYLDRIAHRHFIQFKNINFVQNVNRQNTARYDIILTSNETKKTFWKGAIKNGKKNI